MRAYDGVVFMIDEHMRRLRRSAALIGLDIGKSTEELKLAIYETMQSNNLGGGLYTHDDIEGGGGNRPRSGALQVARL